MPLPTRGASVVVGAGRACVRRRPTARAAGQAARARSASPPATSPASGPETAVATFEMPMYRPVVALGMMSVISAQSTARNAPVEIPTGMIAASIKGKLGAAATPAMPTMPMAMAMKIVRLRPMRSDSRAAGNVVKPGREAQHDRGDDHVQSRRLRSSRPSVRMQVVDARQRSGWRAPSGRTGATRAATRSCVP